jgi:hypothetical protein
MLFVAHLDPPMWSVWLPLASSTVRPGVAPGREKVKPRMILSISLSRRPRPTAFVRTAADISRRRAACWTMMILALPRVFEA